MNVYLWLLPWHGESLFLFKTMNLINVTKIKIIISQKKLNTFNHCDNGNTPMYLRTFTSLVLVETRIC